MILRSAINVGQKDGIVGNTSGSIETRTAPPARQRDILSYLSKGMTYREIADATGTFAYRRVNKKRPNVPEDVLIYKEIVKLGQQAGFHANHVFDTSITGLQGFAAFYYYSCETNCLYHVK